MVLFNLIFSYMCKGNNDCRDNNHILKVNNIHTKNFERD